MPIGLLCYVMVSNDDIFFFCFHFFLISQQHQNSNGKGRCHLFCIGIFKLSTKIYFFFFQRNRIVAGQMVAAGWGHVTKFRVQNVEQK